MTEDFSCKIIPEAEFFSQVNLWKRNKVLSLHLDLKIIFNLQNGKFLSIVRLSLVLKSSEALPKYGKTQIKLPFRNHEIKAPLDKQLIQKLFDTMIHEIMGITIVFLILTFKVSISPMKVLIIGA